MSKNQAKNLLLEAGYLSTYSGINKTFYITDVSKYNEDVPGDKYFRDSLINKVNLSGFTVYLS